MGLSVPVLMSTWEHFVKFESMDVRIARVTMEQLAMYDDS